MLTEHPTKPDTRKRILQAAFTVLSKQGYENTSIKEIADEAGVAQGLVHYYFKSKQQLVLDVCEAVGKKMEYPSDEGTAGAIQAYENFKSMLKNDRNTHALYVQLLAVGIYDQEVGTGILKHVLEDREHIEHIARQVLAERGRSDPQRAKAIASVVEAAVIGIIAQNLLDKTFDADAAVDMLNAMSLAAIAPLEGEIHTEG